jgi:thiamine-monophosphate kinase
VPSLTARVPSIPLGPGREFDAVRDMLRRWGSAARGVGDDCAVLDVPAGERLCASTDASVEGVHFRADWLSPREIGWRATAAALSDLAAAGAAPLGVLLAVSVPERWRPLLGELAEGVGEAARAAGAPIVGGDTTGAAADALSITVTVLGAAPRPLGRAGARAGDRVCVTGALGGPGAALRALERGERPTPEHRARFARPEPRLAVGRWLAERGARAAVDVSDGLLADLAHLAAASGARIRVELERVPRAPGVDPADAARSGEEYELAVAVPDHFDVGACERETGVPLTEIGRVIGLGPGEAPGVEVVRDGARVDLPGGYDHFTS